ncbi:MbtH protein [Pseudomonas sp. NFACC02]|uniref:MbtH family protein n=1 Tax=Pseudomonas sp. NFACC02 TaxID=1566250 RepID=UPI0008C45760|nr:MbtH family NRPS accessory protein [Pseudomonas sp. NFACC02]SEQ54869.1 MbtH protein [Pseudomonas sp. NFACC02]
MNSLNYRVVANEEQQYSLWPADMPIPAGWHGLEQAGSEEACLAYITTHWTDLRPLSLRKQDQK